MKGLAVQPKGTSKKERVEEKMSIVRGVTERSKKMALAWKAGEGPRQGPLGALMRMDLRCHLLVPRLLGKLQAVQTTARRVHMILSDVDVQSLREMKAAQVSLAAPCNCLRNPEAVHSVSSRTWEACRGGLLRAPGRSLCVSLSGEGRGRGVCCLCFGCFRGPGSKMP